MELVYLVLISACIVLPFEILQKILERKDSIEVLSLFKPMEKLTGPEVCKSLREKRKNNKSVSFAYSTLVRLSRLEGKLAWSWRTIRFNGENILVKEYFLPGQ